MNLNINKCVFFEEDTHTYTTIDGKILPGVTTLLKVMLFPDKYKGIPDYVLERAAEYGTRIHSLCQACDMFGESEDDPIEIQNYQLIKEEQKLSSLDNEYLVSDNKTVATLIDCLFVREGKIILSDIKTTAKIDYESLRWQCSIGAYLFELQNPDLKISEISGIWLRKEEYKYVKLERIEDKVIEDLINAFAEKKEFANPLKEEFEELDALILIEDVIREQKKTLKELEDKRDAVLEKLNAKMGDVSKLETDEIIVTRVEPSKSISFDSNKFIKDNPDIDFTGYEKVTERKGYFKVTLK